MTRRSITSLTVLAFCVLLIAAGLAWLQRTESGARWLWSQASSAVPGALEATKVSGDLQSGLRFAGLSFANDSVTVMVKSADLKVSYTLFPLEVSIESLTADNLLITLSTDRNEEAVGSLSDTLAGLGLPLPINFSAVRVNSLTLVSGSGDRLFDADVVTLAGRWYEDLEISSADAQVTDSAWQASGSIQFQPPFPLRLSVFTDYKPAADQPQSIPPFRLHTRAAGNLSTLEVEATADELQLRIHGELLGLLAQPSVKLQLEAAELQWPLISDKPELRMKELTAAVEGALNDYRLEATAGVDYANLPSSRMQLQAQGNSDGVTVHSVQLESEILQAGAHGKLTWLDGLAFQLDTTIDRLDPRTWLPEWPADHPAAGKLTVSWLDDRIALQSFELNAAGTGLRLNGSGTINLTNDMIEGELIWDSLNWPLNAGEPDFSSQHGTLQLSGKPSDWNVSGTLQLQAAEWPQGEIQLTGSGGTESARLNISQGAVLGGQFGGEVHYRWATPQAWSADLWAKTLDISPLVPDYPGVLSAEFHAEGQAAPFQMDIDIKQLEGVIRDKPIAATGGLSFSRGKLNARDLRLLSGTSTINLDGNINDPQGLKFIAKIDSLGAIFAGASGALSGAGRVSLAGEQPDLEFDLQGLGLQWQDIKVGAFKALREQSLTTPATAHFDLTDLYIGEQHVESVTLTAAGPNLFDLIGLNARMNETRLSAQLSGSATELNQLPEFRWQGRVDALTIENDQLSALTLEQPTPLTLEAAAVNLDQACFAGPKSGRICANLVWSDAGLLESHASLEGISLSLVQMFLDNSLELSQTLNGQVNWGKMPGKPLTAQVHIEVSPGKITLTEEEASVSTGPGLLEFSVQDGQLLGGNLDLEMPGAGRIETDFQIPDFAAGLASRIEGRVQVTLNRISPLLDWVPDMESLDGRIDADVRLAGTLEQPKLTGHASLVRGHLEHPASGLVLSEIQLAGAVYQYDYTELHGSFRSGDGRGQLKAMVKFDEFFSPDITLELSGQDLTVFNVPDLTIKADADVRLEWKDGILSPSGRILIPYARISPNFLPTTSASESSDLVIVAGAEPVKEETVFDRSKLRLNGSIDLELGEDVTITLQRATAHLKGRTVFLWENNLLPMADGYFSVTGKISAYGQLLEVEEGRVSFPRIPADNPHLNINAEREIYGNVQVKTAGVLVTGTLKRPVLETYTLPATTPERALTMVVTGRDFDQEQGMGGIEVGMYVAPKLYVSYGIGLFESQSVISARYDLAKGFGIKATSGQRETGADVSYTIER